MGKLKITWTIQAKTALKDIFMSSDAKDIKSGKEASIEDNSFSIISITQQEEVLRRIKSTKLEDYKSWEEIKKGLKLRP